MKRLKNSEYIGKEYINNGGYKFKIIEYYRTDNVVVEFELSKNTKRTQMAHVRRGSVKDTEYLASIKPKKQTMAEYNAKKIKKKREELIGTIHYTNSGEEYEIIDYHGKYNVKIKFKVSGSVMTIGSSRILDGAIEDKVAKSNEYDNIVGKEFKNTVGLIFQILIFSEDKGQALVKFKVTGSEQWARTDNVRRGKVKDYLHPSVSGKGYVGLPDKNVAYYEKAANLWRGMIHRCYDVDFRLHRLSVKKPKVSDRWLCFQYFLEDLPKIKRFDRWLTEPMHLDKDLLGDSLLYDVTTCIFLTPEENRKEQELRQKGLDRELTNLV